MSPPHQNRQRASAFLAIALSTFPLLYPLSAAAKQAKQPYRSPEALLRWSIQAGRNLNIAGTETVIVQPPSGTMMLMTRQVKHSSEGVTLTKWTDPSSQRGLMILDDGTWSKCYNPADKVTKVSRSTPRARDAATAAKLTRLILRNYKVALEGIAPMSGRVCFKLRLTPVHPIGSIVRMWIDRENGAMLSHMESSPQGETLSVASFNGAEFPKRLPASDLIKSFPLNVKEISFSRSEVLTKFDEVRKQAGFEFCAPYSMPGGYEFLNAEILSLNGMPSTLLRYSDGFADLTICQSRVSEQRPAEFRSIQRMVDPMRNNVVDYRAGQMNFILVGRCNMEGLVAITKALDSLKEKNYLETLAKKYSVPMKTLVSLRNRGLGLDTLDALLAVNRDVKKPLSSLVDLCGQGDGWAAIAKRFRANVNGIWTHVKAYECR